MQSAHAHRVHQRTTHEDRDREAPKGWAEDQTKLLVRKMKCASCSSVNSSIDQFKRERELDWDFRPIAG
jgi:hypothetical protein